MAKKPRLGQKQCPKCEKWIKGPRTKVCPKCGHEFHAKTAPKPAAPKPAEAPKAEPVPAAVAAEALVKPAGITLEQIKAVGQMVREIGGFNRLHEMLGVIEEVGGTKKFRDLLEAMAVGESTVEK